MATLQQLEAALVKADAQGNSADAKVFADEIRKMRGETPTPSPQQSIDPTENPEMPGNSGRAAQESQDQFIHNFPFVDRAIAVGTGLKSAVTGGDRFYQDVRAEQKARNEKFDKTHPGERKAGELAADVVAMGAGAAGKSLLGRVANSSGQFGLLSGDRAEDGQIINETGKGALLGATMGAAAETIPALVRAGKATAQGVGRVFKGAKAPKTAELTTEAAEDLLAEGIRAEGGSFETMAQRAETLGADANVANTMGVPGDNLLGTLARRQPGVRREAEKVGGLLDRAKGSTSRTRSDLEVTGRSGDNMIASEQGLEAERAAIGSKIQKFSDDFGEEALTGQEELNAFLAERPNILKEAKNRIRLSENPVEVKYAPLKPQANPAKVAVDDAEGVEQLIVTNRLAEEVKAVLSTKTGNIKQGAVGGDKVQSLKQENMWSKLVDENSPKEITALRQRYGTIKGEQRAFEEGTKFSTTSVSDLKKWVKADGRTKAEIDKFQHGVIQDLSNKSDDVASAVTKKTEQLEAIFGRERADFIKKVLDREKVFNEQGAVFSKNYDAAVSASMDDVAAGRESLWSWWERFKGKRAYSTKGGGFLIANELIDAMVTPGISNAVQAEIGRILLKSGGDLPTIIRKIGESTLSRKLKTEMIQRANAYATKTIKAASVPAGTSVMGNITGEKDAQGTTDQGWLDKIKKGIGTGVPSGYK